jgi:hypothetical protein
MKMKQVAVLALIALISSQSVGSAGPITWSYSSSGVIDGNYRVDPASIPFTTLSGDTQNIYLIGGVTQPLVIGPNPPQGPTFWNEVTIFDTGSGRSGMFTVPIQFSNPIPSAWSGWYQYTPQVGAIAPVNLTLGEHRYEITNGPGNALQVKVGGVPEPATFAMAGIGFGGIGLTRWRRRQLRKSPLLGV